MVWNGGVVLMAIMDRSCRVQVVKIRLDAREKGWPGFRFGARVPPNKF
jgi:hypothetical protein